jgi:hypothetical protein
VADWLKPTISQSEIIFLITGPPEKPNPKAAAEGTRIHRQILGDLIQRNIRPKGLDKIDLRPPIEPEKPLKLEIKKGLSLSGEADIVSRDCVVEIKPGNEGSFKPRYLFQTAVMCLLTGIPNGFIFQYGDGNVVQVEDGGRAVWEDIKMMGIWARTILDVQTEFDESKWKMPLNRRNSLGQKSADAGSEFGKLIKKVMSELTKPIPRRYPGIDLKRSTIRFV